MTLHNASGTILCTTTAQADGTWSCTPGAALSEGTTTYIVTSEDDALPPNATVSAALTLTIDTTAPNAPSITAPSNALHTNDTTPNLSLTGEANAGVTFFVRDASGSILETLTGTTNGSGIFTTTPSILSDGSYLLDATLTDIAGNTSVLSSQLSFVIDTTEGNTSILT